jgi:large subunit ribosomal protein L3
MSFEKELGLVGTKIGMTHVFDEDGNVVPVTAIQITENIITDIKNPEKHGYNAVQLGNITTKEHRLNKPHIGNLKKKNLPFLKELQEFRTNEPITAQIGDAINAEEFFKDLKKVNVIGISIGKGFQGGIKLYNMGTGPRSHGSKSKRIIGSLGAGTTPGRVFPGKRMPSMMGNCQVTTTKAKVFSYDPEQRIVLIKGPVPGKPGAVLTIKPFGIKTWNHNNKQKVAA